MATNFLTQSPLSATGVRPGQWFLTSTEDFNTLTSPGFLNGVASTGFNLQINDVVFAQYDSGDLFGLFIVSIIDDVIKLNVYSPNDNSFVFTQTQFVAKGGSDLNAGTSIGLPKLTIQAAIDALMLSPSNPGVVIVMDAETYDENLTLAYDVVLNAISATLTCSTGDLITINDTGVTTQAIVYARNIDNQGPGKAIDSSGVQSGLTINSTFANGDISLEGGLDAHIDLLQNSTITTSANAVLSLNIDLALSVTTAFDPASTISGYMTTLSGTTVYSEQTFQDQIFFSVTPVDETVGRSITATDNNKRVIYNNAASDNFTLETTSTEPMSLGSRIEFTQLGAGSIDFVAGSGATILSVLGATVSTAGMGATAVAYKYTDTVWLVSGELTAPGP